MKYKGMSIVLLFIHIMILTGNSLDTYRTDKVIRQNQENMSQGEMYSIKTASFRQCRGDKLVDIDLSFPQIVGMGDKEIQDKINKSIYSRCVKERDKDWNGLHYEIKADYEIKYADKDVLSILFHFENTDVTRFFNRRYGMTIDMGTGELIPPDNYISKEGLDTFLYSPNKRIHTDSPDYEEYLQYERTVKKLYEYSPIFEMGDPSMYEYCLEKYYLTKDSVVVLFDMDVVSTNATVGIKIPR